MNLERGSRVYVGAGIDSYGRVLGRLHHRVPGVPVWEVELACGDTYAVVEFALIDCTALAGLASCRLAEGGTA